MYDATLGENNLKPCNYHKLLVLFYFSHQRLGTCKNDTTIKSDVATVILTVNPPPKPDTTELSKRGISLLIGSDGLHTDLLCPSKLNKCTEYNMWILMTHWISNEN